MSNSSAGALSWVREQICGVSKPTSDYICVLIKKSNQIYYTIRMMGTNKYNLM